ncbi:MAG: hypothetical protein AAGN66_22965 [Acidobacteriota bacterium]
MESRRPVFFPAAFGILPALSLYAENWRLASPVEGFVCVVLALLLALAFWGLNHLWMRDAIKSGLATLLFVLLFYSYGAIHRHVFDTGDPETTGGHTTLLWIYALLLVLGTSALARLRRDLRRAALVLDVAAVAALAGPLLISLYSIASHYGQEGGSGPGQDVAAAAPQRPPDIYYVVVDGYARADTLERLFDFDNRPFLEALESRGFHVARESYSNYNQTYLSVASSLNYTYLHELEALGPLAGSPSRARKPLRTLIGHSRARRALAKIGYRFVTFPSGYSATRMPEPDILIEGGWAPSELQNTLLAKTPVPGLMLTLLDRDQYHWHRQRILNVLENLHGLAGKLDTPIFVFAHLYSPHPPFVFDADGNPTSSGRPFLTSDGNHFFRDGGQLDEYLVGYPAQVEFLNRRLLAAFDSILERSATPPVILLQSDHGSGLGMDHESLEGTDLEERYGILNALHIPAAGSLDDDLSPVNSFRVVFNAYFDAGLPLASNRSFHARWRAPYQWVEVTQELGATSRHAAAPVAAP